MKYDKFLEEEFDLMGDDHFASSPLYLEKSF